MNSNYWDIVFHYESCLEKFGDTHLGVDWPNLNDAHLRYKVMLELIKDKKAVSLLDFGCGTSHLYEYISANQIKFINYSGLDISDKFIQVAKQKFPEISYYCCDILESDEELPIFDYVIMNGVFTEKRNLSFDDMYNYFQKVLLKIFPKVRSGLALNVMSKQVDWERDDLFHLPFDMLAEFLRKHISRHFIVRHDYKLFEYTVYIYRFPGC